MFILHSVTCQATYIDSGRSSCGVFSWLTCMYNYKFLLYNDSLLIIKMTGIA